MLTRLPMKFLSTLINAQILRDGLAHSQNGSHFSSNTADKTHG